MALTIKNDRAVALARELAAATGESMTQADIAADAHREFGRASGHPARLNFGDCVAYAAAIDADEPLCFVGDDFGHTDVRVAR